MELYLSWWDLVMLLGVTLQATILAYIKEAKWKTYIMFFPIPFTLASLAVARPVDATNVTGLLLFMLFMHGIRIMHDRYNLNIIISIGAVTLGFMVSGSLLAKVIPSGTIAFWVAATITILAALVMLKVFPYKTGTGYRTPLPIWIKVPAIMGVLATLILLKGMLRGFTTTFPMIGIVISYETRKSLWTTCQGVPEAMFNVMVLIITCRLLQEPLGLIPALGIGWLLLGLLVFPLAARRVAKRA